MIIDPKSEYLQDLKALAPKLGISILLDSEVGKWKEDFQITRRDGAVFIPNQKIDVNTFRSMRPLFTQKKDTKVLLQQPDKAQP